MRGGGVRDTKHGAGPLQDIRDRIRELRRVRARDLKPNPKNWRRHPGAQAAALRGLLTEIGYADALLTRELPDGSLIVVDGHVRAETTPDAEVPVLILDISDEEADKLLLTLDPLAAMAEADSERIKDLLHSVQTDSTAVEDLLRRVAGEQLWRTIHPQAEPLRSTRPVNSKRTGIPDPASYGVSVSIGCCAVIQRTLTM